MQMPTLATGLPALDPSAASYQAVSEVGVKRFKSRRLIGTLITSCQQHMDILVRLNLINVGLNG